MKKVLPLLVVVIFVLTGLGAGAFLGDELDQSQTVMTENAALPVGQVPIPDNLTYFQVAQSFIPTKEVLTLVELYIGKNSTATSPYVLAVRADLTGEDMTLTSVDPEDVVTEDFGWVEFDFDDVMTTIGQTYYIVSYTENVTDNFYGWGANNDSESYLYGCAWMSLDGGDTWSNESASAQQGNVETWFNPAGRGSFNENNVTWDMCFKTYGRDNSPPNIPTIDGQTNGKAGTPYEYTFLTTDPDGDDVYYCIDWGDDSGEVCIGPYASGENATAIHTWGERGIYTIRVKAKDVYDAESDWATLEVTMPKSRLVSNTLFLRLLERFPHAFPILRHLLGL